MKRALIIIPLLLALVAGGLFLLWPRGPKGLVLYSAVDYGPVMAAAYTKATGIPVSVVQLSTGTLLARVSAEGRRPDWSMVWFDGDLAADALDQAGLLARHTAPALPWTKLGRSLLPADGAYVPTGMTLAGVFTWRAGSGLVPPKTWNDLLAPRYKNAVGMNNPAISGPMYPQLAGMLAQGGGWPAGKAYVLGLKDNGLKIYAKNANTMAALQQGHIRLAMIQSSHAYYVARTDPALKVTVPEPAFALPSVIGLSPRLSPKARAQALGFMRFVMSPAGQKLRMTEGEEDGYYWPLTRGVSALPGLPPLSSLHVERLSPAKWGPREEVVNAWFSKMMFGQ